MGGGVDGDTSLVEGMGGRGVDVGGGSFFLLCLRGGGGMGDGMGVG